MNLILIQ